MLKVVTTRALALLAVLFAVSLHAQQPMRVVVDATDAPRKIFHSHSVIPAAPGPMKLAYAKWIPGEHGPTGPITNLVNIRITANGQPLPWTRDARNMYVLGIDVPKGASAIEVDLTYLSPIAGGNFTSGPSATANAAIISWNTLILFPLGKNTDDIPMEGSIRIPEGWTQAGPLQANERASVTTYIDSPVILGRYVKTIDLPSGNGPKHRINLSGESRAAVDTPATFADDYGRLVAEAGALFGAYHFRHYDWLVTLSDDVAHFGLEHHESSDNRMEEETLETENMRRALAGLLSHEYMHSWNAKYRRPAIMLSPDYQQPMEGNLLWVYEGLTQYLASLMTTRSGLWSQDFYRENLSVVAARFDVQPGRTWRSLSDTAVAAQTLFGSPSAWESSRRSTDFYDEAILLWLEADSIIRQKTNNRASLDDFMRRFHGGNTGLAELKPYTYDELIAALNATAPYEWRKHFDERLSSLSPRAPVGGITNNGWKLSYSETPNDSIKAGEDRRKIIDLTYSLGMTLKNGENADRGTVRDVWIDGPAGKAGIGPGMKIIAVNGRRWTRDVMDKALKAKGPMELLIQNNEEFKTYSVDYHGGPRYPHLVREDGKADGLAEVLKARRQ
jgi:predicted metalloprotease with PDZ domain